MLIRFLPSDAVWSADGDDVDDRGEFGRGIITVSVTINHNKIITLIVAMMAKMDKY